MLTKVIITILLFSILGQFGKYYWAFDLFSHFTLQYFYLNFLFLILIFILNKKNFNMWSLVFLGLVLNTLNLWPFYYDLEPIRSIASKPLKIVSLNINSQNKNFELIQNYLKNYEPDIVFLIELSPNMGSQLSSLKSDYPYGSAVMDEGPFGIGIISKVPLQNTEVHRQDISQIPFISSQIQMSGSSINIIAVHPFPPLDSEGTQLRNTYLNQLSKFVQKNNTPTILCGDLNTTPWSYQIKKMVSETELEITHGNGVIPTWPSALPFLRIPIDYCLTSKTIRVYNYSRGPYLGSDHFPFQMEVDLQTTR